MRSASTSSSTAAYNPPLRENVFKFRNPARLVTEISMYGRDDIMSKLGELVTLEPGWDGYQAPAVSFQNASFALRMIEAICGQQTPAPQIVPGSGGDLQVEWHLANGDVELHVRSPNDVQAWRRIPGDSEDGEAFDLKNDFTDVAHWVAAIAETGGAANTAAA